MAVFKSARSYWEFAHSVRTERRFIHARKARAFLRAVQESATRRVDIMKAGGYLWRAQRGGSTVETPIDGTDDTVTEDCPYKTERMKPPRGRARENRVNPKGMPYLYLATKRDTAVAEVRPWKGGVVSVGQFQVIRDLRLVNTTLGSEQTFYFFKEPSPKKREEAVWGDIDHAFAEPTTLSDDASEYVPTQILGELFRDAGFDGVAYGSSYGPGHNICSFDIDLAEHVNCYLIRVKDIKFVLDEEQRFAYTVKKAKKKAAKRPARRRSRNVRNSDSF